MIMTLDRAETAEKGSRDSESDVIEQNENVLLNEFPLKCVGVDSQQ